MLWFLFYLIFFTLHWADLNMYVYLLILISKGGILRFEWATIQIHLYSERYLVLIDVSNLNNSLNCTDAFDAESRWPRRRSSHEQIKHNLNGVQWRLLPTQIPQLKTALSISQEAFKIPRVGTSALSAAAHLHSHKTKVFFFYYSSHTDEPEMWQQLWWSGFNKGHLCSSCANGNHGFSECVHVLWA